MLHKILIKNKNLIKHLFTRPITIRSHSILFYLGTSYIPNKIRKAHEM